MLAIAVETGGMRHELALAWVAFVFLAIAASPSHFWLDSGEIAAAGAGLGVMHPTGVPGYVAILHLATALPIGALGQRMALVSSACMAGAIALIVAILRRRDVHWALVWVIGLWLPLGLTLARNGRVVEIYGFAALLLSAVLWGFDPAVAEPQRLARRCIGVIAAVIAAWGFGDLRLALVAPVILVWVLAWRRAEPWARWAPLCVALASAVVLTLPLASVRGPIADWGDPEDWRGIWAHLQAQLIRDSFATKLAGMGPSAWLLEARLAAIRLVEDLGPFGLLLALASLLFGLTRPLSTAARERKAARGDAAAAAKPDAGSGSDGDGDPDVDPDATPQTDADHRLLRWLGGSPSSSSSTRPPSTPWAAATARPACCSRSWQRSRSGSGSTARPSGVHRCVGSRCPCWPARCGSHPRSRASTTPRSPDPGRRTQWTREVLARAPTDALVLTQSDDLNAGIAYARAVEGARPDLVAIPAQHLYRPPSDGNGRRLGARRSGTWSPRANASDHDRSSRCFGAGVGPWSSSRRDGRARWGRAAWRWRAADLDRSSSRSSPTRCRPCRGRYGIGRQRRSAGRGDRAMGSTPDDERRPGPLGRRARAVDRWRPLALARVPGPLAQGRAGLSVILAEVLPDHARALIGLGAMRDYFGQTDDAIALTRRALEIDPERTTALTNLASVSLPGPDPRPRPASWPSSPSSSPPASAGVWMRLLLVCQAQQDAACVARAERSSGVCDMLGASLVPALLSASRSRLMRRSLVLGPELGVQRERQRLPRPGPAAAG